MKKILTVLGARPQIIKSAAITRAIQTGFSAKLEEVVFNTGQHYDANMSDDFFEELFIPPPKYTYTIDFQKQFPINQMIEGIEKAIKKEKPDVILVYGDTNSTLAGAISAVKANIPLVHVEAGLRSFNIEMPEEGNRILTDHSSRLLFSPTEEGVKNLSNENINKEFVFHCGDIMYDNSLYYMRKAEEHSSVLNDVSIESGDFILFTCHRQSNTDSKENLLGVLNGVRRVAQASHKKVVFPIHPRTKKQIVELLGKEFLKGLEDEFIIIPPSSFLDTILLESNAAFVMTDSGGIQKEAYFFNKTSLILREQTEWIEIIENNAALLVGANEDDIVEGYKKLQLLSPNFEPIFGDGKAGEFICNKILEELI